MSLVLQEVGNVEVVQMALKIAVRNVSIIVKDPFKCSLVNPSGPAAFLSLVLVTLVERLPWSRGHESSIVFFGR